MDVFLEIVSSIGAIILSLLFSRSGCQTSSSFSYYLCCPDENDTVIKMILLFFGQMEFYRFCGEGGNAGCIMVWKRDPRLIWSLVCFHISLCTLISTTFCDYSIGTIPHG